MSEPGRRKGVRRDSPMAEIVLMSDPKIAGIAVVDAGSDCSMCGSALSKESVV